MSVFCRETLHYATVTLAQPAERSLRPSSVTPHMWKLGAPCAGVNYVLSGSMVLQRGRTHADELGHVANPKTNS